MRKAVVCLIILIGIGIAAYFIFNKDDTKPDYKTEKVEKGDIQDMVTATGTVNAVVNVLVGTQVSGTISRLFVDYNSQVKKGQILALIDPANFEAQVAQARANLLNVEAGLKKAQAVLAEGLRTLERNKALLKKNFVAQSDVDTAQMNADSAAAQADASKAQIEQMRAALKIAETNLSYTRIVSPVDGTVISRSIDVGQTVAASFQTPTLFTIAQDLREMQIETNVDEADIGKVKVGQEVHFNVDAYPEEDFKGAVKTIRNAPVTVQNVVTYVVIIDVDNLDLKLKPGMTANVSIIITQKKDALLIPNAALRFKPAEASNKKGQGKKPRSSEKPEKKGPSVWVLDKEKLAKVFVETGISDGTHTEIVSGGLKESADVIVEDATESKKKAKEAGPRMFH